MSRTSFDDAGREYDVESGEPIRDTDGAWLGPFDCRFGHGDCSQTPGGKCTLAASSDLMTAWMREHGYDDIRQVPEVILEFIYDDITERTYPSDPKTTGRVPRPSVRQ